MFAPLLAVLILGLLGSIGVLNPVVSHAAATPAAVSWHADVRPVSIEAVAALDPVLPSYQIDADLVVHGWAEPAVIRGTIAIRWVNDGPAPATELPLRLYPNASGYEEGGMVVERIAVDGQPVEATVSGDGTVLVAPLPEPVEPGDAAALTAQFSTTVPIDSTTAFGIFSVKTTARTIALAHWHPLLAGSDERGWSLEPFSRNGDPVFAPAAHFDVTLRAPEQLVIVASGVETSPAAANGRVEWSIRAGPVRELGLVAASRWAPGATSSGDVDISVWSMPGDDTAAAVVLTAAEAALRGFEGRFGPYPYTELDVATVDLNGAVGMEYPGLILVSPAIFDAVAAGDRFAETVVAHEIAHQWWYGVVGSNHHRHAFIDEGLAELSGVALYLEDRYGREVADAIWDAEVVSWWERAREQGPALPAASATDDFADRAAYAAAVYPQAAIGFAAIRERIGDDAFFAALAAVVREHAFGVVEPSDLKSAFAEACTCDIGSTWDAAFETGWNP
jgi:hypothetical protein